MIVAVVACPVKEIDHSTRHAGSRSVEAIIDAHFQSSDVKVVEVAVQCCVTIPGFEVSVVFFSESLSEKVSNVSKYYKDEIGDVGCKKVVVGWLVHYWFRELSAVVSTGVSVCLGIEGSKLGMLPCQSACFSRRGWLEECSRRLVHVGRVRCGGRE